jgi:hypothetical protein
MSSQISLITSECPLTQMYALAGNLDFIDQKLPFQIPSETKKWLLGLIREQMSCEIKSDFHGRVYEVSPHRADEWGWGEKHAFDNLNIVRKAIEQIAHTKFQSIEPASKNDFCGTIYNLAGSPETDDFQWGEHHATENTERLLLALHKHGEIQDHHPTYFDDYEKHVHSHSSTFSLNRREPQSVRIGYVNGMLTSYDQSRFDAFALSDKVAHGYNIHGVHAATTTDATTDVAEILLEMSGVLTPPVRLIHETWQKFFQHADSEQLFIQICTSKGAVHVKKALESFSNESLCRRIVVFAIAPAVLMPKGRCLKAYHYIIPSDTVPYLITSHIPEMKSRMAGQDSDIIFLQDHEDGSISHNIHGSSYMERIPKDILKYLS